MFDVPSEIMGFIVWVSLAVICFYAKRTCMMLEKQEQLLKFMHQTQEAEATRKWKNDQEVLMTLRNVESSLAYHSNQALKHNTEKKDV